MTLSIGMARLEGAGETLDDLVARADRALYMAEEAGRNRVQVHECLGQVGA